MSSKYSLFIGRWQAPEALHDGHKALIGLVLAEGKKVCIAIRDTPVDASNPLSAAHRKRLIRLAYPDYRRVKIIVIPDIEAVCYGRDVGYEIRRIELGPATEAISATKLRQAQGVDYENGVLG